MYFRKLLFHENLLFHYFQSKLNLFVEINIKY